MKLHIYGKNPDLMLFSKGIFVGVICNFFNGTETCLLS